MAKREVNYPHTIGFRLSDEAWFRIEQEVVNTHLTPHDWCRKVVLKTLDDDYGLSKHERLLFYQLSVRKPSSPRDFKCSPTTP